MSRAGIVCLLLAQTLSADQSDFFEKNVRPVLAAKCYGCHSSKLKAPLAGIRLDSPDETPRLATKILEAISYDRPVKMPPGGRLPDSEIQHLTTWANMGAPVPAILKQTETTRFWAFEPVKKPNSPTTIDAFLNAKLQEKGLTPAAKADRRTLIRRVTFDLIGLPPTPDEIQNFLNDTSKDAYRKVVDGLLASPHYGERWARHWLDLVRYAETNGHEYDNDKHEPWRYRDYVIRAFNEDIPYNQFVREHIAGDLLANKRLRNDGAAWESPVGTTQLWFNEVLNSATDSEKSRADDVDNQIDVAGKAFLGLTVACARCHDHKFDPIPTADYYGLAGVFHSTELREAVIDSPEKTRKIAEISAKIKALYTPPAVPPSKVNLRPGDKLFESFATFDKWTPQGAAFGNAPVNGIADSRSAGGDVFFGTITSGKFRTGKELYLHVRIAGSKTPDGLKERGNLRFTIVADGYKGQHIIPEGDDNPKWKTLTLTFERERTCYFEIVDRARDGHILIDEIVFSDSKTPPETQQDPVVAKAAPDLSALESQVPDSEFAMIAEDRDPHNVRLHIRGSHKNLGEEVPRHFLKTIAGENQPPIQQGSGRLQIAEWMASERNPLTARVMVNRIWKHHFGNGIVRTSDNFGRMGEAPTHPELLDFLAASFIESGWSTKAMHRMIVLSDAYQRQSTPSDEAKKIDPTNKLLQHMSVSRLEGEAIRDALLSISGSLNPKLYGPSVPPHISAYQDGRGKPKSGPLDGDGRRSIYIQVRRNFMTPMFTAFDYPTPISTIGSRTVSTVPSQALLMMNNEFVAQQAGKWAERVLPATNRIQQMYEMAFSRPATPEEITTITSFVDSQKGRSEKEVWTDVAHVLINSAEFVYVP